MISRKPRWKTAAGLLAVVAGWIAGITAQSAKAETVTVDLPLAGRTYSHSIENLKVPIDLGVKFSEIQSVRVELLGRLLLPEADESVYLEERWLKLTLDDVPKGMISYGGTLSHPAKFATVDYGDITKWTADFSASDADFTALLAGKGNVTLVSAFWIYMLAEGAKAPLSPSGAEFTQATLTVNGTVVPEPSALVIALIAVPAVALAIRRRK
jgi:hypothetical protein